MGEVTPHDRLRGGGTVSAVSVFVVAAAAAAAANRVGVDRHRLTHASRRHPLGDNVRTAVAPGSVLAPADTNAAHRG
eukprot:COSAG01_NODE_4506_length_4966_cov_76.601561_2_plen_77_part_00